MSEVNKKEDTVRETVKRVVVVIAILFLVEMFVTVFFLEGGLGGWNREKITILLGLLAGSIMGAGMFLHIKKTLEESFAFGEKSAPTHMKKTYIFRISIVGILMILAAWSGWFNILALLLGIMNLKIAVYLQPILNKIFR